VQTIKFLSSPLTSESHSARSLLGLRMLLVGEMHSMLDGLHKT
jgi:hypothetical protein